MNKLIVVFTAFLSVFSLHSGKHIWDPQGELTDLQNDVPRKYKEYFIVKALQKNASKIEDYPHLLTIYTEHYKKYKIGKRALGYLFQFESIKKQYQSMQSVDFIETMLDKQERRRKKREERGGILHNTHTYFLSEAEHQIEF